MEENRNVEIYLPQLVEKINELREVETDIKSLNIKASNIVEKIKKTKEKSAVYRLFNNTKINTENIEELASYSAECASIIEHLIEFHQRQENVNKFLMSLNINSIADIRAVRESLKQMLNDEERSDFSSSVDDQILAIIGQIKEKEDYLFKLQTIEEKCKTISNDNKELKNEIVKGDKKINTQKRISIFALILSSLSIVLIITIFMLYIFKII